MNHLPNETTIPVLLFLLNCPVADSDVKDKKKKKKQKGGGGKCTLNIWIYSELLSLSSIHHVPHRTGTAQRFIYFSKEGRLVCHQFGMCSKNLLELSIWAQHWRHLAAAWNLFLSFFFRSLKPTPTVATASINCGKWQQGHSAQILENLGENGVLV